EVGVEAAGKSHDHRSEDERLQLEAEDALPRSDRDVLILADRPQDSAPRRADRPLDAEVEHDEDESDQGEVEDVEIAAEERAEGLGDAGDAADAVGEPAFV